MALDAVIFDIDGTLVDTNPSHVEAWRRAFERCGYTIMSDRIEIEIGKGGDRLVTAVLGAQAEARDGEALRRVQKEEFLAIAKQHRFRLFPRVRELFAGLRERGLGTALATSSNEQHLEGLLASVGVDLRKVTDVLVNADDIESSKPAPDLVVAAVRKLGLSPAQCAMVGDTIYDAESSRPAGVVCLGVLSGGVAERDLLRAGMRAVWPDTGALCAQLDEALAIASPGPAHLTATAVERLMHQALEQARRAMRAGEIPIGCVLARGDGTILAAGYSETRGRASRIAHGELVTLERAAGRIWPDATDMVLVSTLEPCVMCTGAAMETGVDTILFALPAPDDSGTGRVRPPESRNSRMPRVVGGVLANESRLLFEEWLKTSGGAEQRPFVEQLLART